MALKFSDYNEFMKKHIAKDVGNKEEREKTHTRIPHKLHGIYGGAFNITNEEEFHKLYVDHVFKKGQKEYLTEKQLKEDGPMAVDMDFRYAPDIDCRQHTSEHVLNIVLAYLDELKKIYEFDNETKFDVFVMEKPNVNQQDNLTKDGIHMLFGLKVDYETQKYIRKQLLVSLPKEIELPIVCGWDTVLDEGITKGTTNWQLYGSRKPNHEAYVLTRFWNVSFDTKDKEFVMDEFEGSTFDVHQHFGLLSVRNTTRPQFPKKKSFQNLEQKQNKKSAPSKSVALTPTYIVEDDETKSLLFDVIGTDKPTLKFPIWWAILGILKYNGFAKDFWMEWNSKIDLSASQRKPSEMWDGPSGMKPVDIGVLQYIGKQINPDAFDAWKKRFCPNENGFELSDWYKSGEKEDWFTIVKKTVKTITKEQLQALNKLKPFHSTYSTGLVADLFKVLYENKFKFCDGVMYNFNSVYWCPDDKALSNLHNFVDKQFMKAMSEYCDTERPKWTALLADADEEVVKNAQLEIFYINSFHGKVMGLRKIKNRKEQIQDICHRLSDNKAEWNKNAYLFAFENVIFDLKTGNQVAPNPMDFINFTCGYNYDPNYDKTKVETLNKIIDTIFVEKELKDYYLEILSTGLCGVRVEKVYIATGKGGNGKSLLNGLAYKTCGNYAYNLPASLMSEKIKLGGNPEAALMDFKRLVFFTEPDEKSPLCCAVLKTLTGENTLGVRMLHSNKVGISLNLTLVGSCNNKPDLDEVNDAVSRRLKGGIIPFKSKFVPQSTIDELTKEFGEKPSNVFLGNDHFISDQFQNDYKQALFQILLERFQTYMKNSLDFIPNEVLTLSRQYMAGSDDIYEWFNDTYEKCSDEMVFVDDVFAQFSSSVKFIQMTKIEKRKFGSVGKFKDKLESNLFIGRYYRVKDKYFMKERQKRPFIEGWRLKENQHQGQNSSE